MGTVSIGMSAVTNQAFLPISNHHQDKNTMSPETASSTITSFAALSIGAPLGQPTPPAGAVAPSVQSRPQRPASSFADNDDFATAPGKFDAGLDALTYQLKQLKAPDSANLADIVRLFSSLKANAADIERALWQAPDGAPVSRLSDAVVTFLRQFNHALGQQPELCDILDASDIRSLCLGLSVCASPSAGVLFDAAQQRRVGPALQGITERLLKQLSVLGMPESASANGVVLDTLNWVSRGLKSELLESSKVIRESYGQALGLLASWLGSDHSRGFLSVHQLAKCAVQVDLMVKRSLVPLKADTAQGVADQLLLTQCADNRAFLRRCAMGLGSPSALARLDTGAASSSSSSSSSGSTQRTVDAVSLINLCNAFRTLLDTRVLQADDSDVAAPLSRLLNLMLHLTPQQLCAGTSQTLSNCSNFVRTLFEMGLHAQPGMTQALENASTQLIATINGPAYAQGYANSQAISNLMSFIKLCDKQLKQPNTGKKPFSQADLVRAASTLYGQLMTHDADEFHGVEAIGGLLSGLCYLWRQGLLLPCGTEREWVASLMRSVAGIDAARWGDKSRKVMLPALQVLVEMGAMTLGAAQPALAVLLRGPAGASSGYTAADLAQAIMGLGVAEESVLALPPDAIALPVSAPAPAPAAPPAELPRAIPGLTRLVVEVPAAPPLTASTIPAPAQRREHDRVAQGEWQMPVKVARNESRHAPMPEVDASWPTWSDTGMSTATPSTTSTTTITTTSSSTATSSTTSTSKPAKKGAQAEHKPPKSAPKARPQKPAQQWFALLKNKGGIDLKRLQDLARSQPGLVNKADESDRNALFHAIAAGNEKVLAWIIAHEAHVMPTHPAQFVELLMDEVLLYSPAFGTALRRFLGAQTAAVKEALRTHFARKPPIMKGVEDILAELGLIKSKQVTANDRAAAELLQRSTSDALSILGTQAVRSQSGVSMDDEASFLLIQMAARQGLADAEYSLGNRYENGMGVARDEWEAVRWYRKAAQQGFAAAQYALGILYGQGISVAKNEKEAVRLFQQAAQQGNPGAENSLGYCYQHGIGVAKDEKEAVRWYQRSADQCDANAQFNMGRCHEHGIGVTKSEKEAVRWYRKAADQGLDAAETNLGNCYLHGTGVEKDEKEAVRWYRKAADQGFALAENSLGCCYQRGIGVAKNLKEAVLWFEKAALHGHAEAQYNFGVHYQYGDDSLKDEKAAVYWYQQAAMQGQPDAQYNLGLCYYKGVGVAVDRDKASGWLNKAAAQGHGSALELMRNLLASLLPTDGRM
jgi:TPR repeat protein